MKIASLFMTLIIALGVSAISGCNATAPDDSGKLQIISTIFPTYDFARQICGDKADVTMLLSPGAESHSYDPTPQERIKILGCDLFLYVGGESDTWVNDMLKSSDKTVNTLKMMECVNAVEEEITEGMESDEHEHADEDAAGDEHEEEKEYDEHVWTSPQNAVKIVNSMVEAICAVDPDNGEIYRANGQEYIDKLNALDGEFRELFDSLSSKTMVFGDRFPFRYFADEYGIEYYAAFTGCSTETEPSAATIKFLTDKVKAEGISTVYYIEFSNHSIADSIAEAASSGEGQQVSTALFHSCHNVTATDFTAGVTYIDLMRGNLETLKATMK